MAYSTSGSPNQTARGRQLGQQRPEQQLGHPVAKRYRNVKQAARATATVDRPKQVAQASRTCPPLCICCAGVEQSTVTVLLIACVRLQSTVAEQSFAKRMSSDFSAFDTSSAEWRLEDWPSASGPIEEVSRSVFLSRSLRVAKDRLPSKRQRSC